MLSCFFFNHSENISHELAKNFGKALSDQPGGLKPPPFGKDYSIPADEDFLETLNYQFAGGLTGAVGLHFRRPDHLHVPWGTGCTRQKAGRFGAKILGRLW